MAPARGLLFVESLAGGPEIARPRRRIFEDILLNVQLRQGGNQRFVVHLTDALRPSYSNCPGANADSYALDDTVDEVCCEI